jgi:hypothetical protein
MKITLKYIFSMAELNGHNQLIAHASLSQQGGVQSCSCCHGTEKKHYNLQCTILKTYIIITKHTAVMWAEGVVLWEVLATSRIRG